MSAVNFVIKQNLDIKGTGVNNFAGSLNAAGGYVGALTGNASTATALRSRTIRLY